MTSNLGNQTCPCTPGCTIPYGTCHCGCGQETTIATQSETANGYTAGEPKRFVRGHAGHKITHGLSDVDETMRTATCSICGPVSIRIHGKTKTGRTQWRCLGRLVTQHYLVNIDPESRTADCRGCGSRVGILQKADRGKGWVCSNREHQSAEDYRNANAEVIKEKHAEWRERNPAYRRQVRDAALKRAYGVTGAEYDAQVAKRFGRCDICGGEPNAKGTNGTSLCVDHDHENGRIRGYLDRDCNSGLGSFRDDPVRMAKAIVYLKPSREEILEAGRILLEALQEDGGSEN
jgi:hypothetical protein